MADDNLSLRLEKMRGKRKKNGREKNLGERRYEEESPNLEQQAEKEVRQVTQVTNPGTWNMYIDGSSNFRGSGLGVVLKSAEGDMMVQSICCELKATNNEAEHEALIAGMNLTKDLGASKLQVFCDSLLVASQMNGEFAAKDSKMILYLDLAKSIVAKFATFSIKQIPRDQNTQAGALATLGSALKKSKFSSIPLVHLLAPAINKEAHTPKPVNPNPARSEPENSNTPKPI
uniref:RNase H type-1 domain-containing protein n=1 Tax=Chenopodium quinoa TaxID=63459 RepID=A0A803MV83_CHEQI